MRKENLGSWKLVQSHSPDLNQILMPSSGSYPTCLNAGPWQTPECGGWYHAKPSRIQDPGCPQTCCVRITPVTPGHVDIWEAQILISSAAFFGIRAAGHIFRGVSPGVTGFSVWLSRGSGK